MKIRLKTGKLIDVIPNEYLNTAKYINEKTNEFVYDDEIKYILNMDNIISRGKELAWLLRHDKESYEDGFIDNEGWRRVDELIKNHHYTKDLLDDIVATNNKQRYEYNEDKTKIRARQGHSIPVDVGMKEADDITEDMAWLYHGTSEKFIEDIKKNGLLPQTRQYVHLSPDTETAYNVGKRHGGKTYIIMINAWQMKLDGEKIYISNNGVYNVKYVDPKYFYCINKYN